MTQNNGLIRINQSDQIARQDAPLINAGQLVGTRVDSDVALIAGWIATMSSAGTREQYAMAVKGFLDHVNLPLQAIVLEDLQSWVSSLDGLRPATQNQRIGIIKSLFTHAHKLGYLKANIGAMVKVRATREIRSERILSEEEVLRLMMACDTLRDSVLLRMLYRTGGRVSEVIGVKWNHIQVSPSRTVQVTLLGKGSRIRTVLIPPDLHKSLIEYREISGDVDDDTRVFSLTRARVWAIVKRIARLAGITKPVSPHWFRHSHATHALNHDAPLKLVSQTLGHASIATTDRYLHNQPDTASGDYLKIG